jgi:hypothetical protein
MRGERSLPTRLTRRSSGGGENRKVEGGGRGGGAEEVCACCVLVMIFGDYYHKYHILYVLLSRAECIGDDRQKSRRLSPLAGGCALLVPQIFGISPFQT